MVFTPNKPFERRSRRSTSTGAPARPVPLPARRRERRRRSASRRRSSSPSKADACHLPAPSPIPARSSSGPSGQPHHDRIADPLVSSAQADRLHYATGELLGADDFRDEQTYHRRQLARALLYLYGSGTIAGLRVVAAAPARGERRARRSGTRSRAGPRARSRRPADRSAAPSLPAAAALVRVRGRADAEQRRARRRRICGSRGALTRGCSRRRDRRGCVPRLSSLRSRLHARVRQRTVRRARCVAAITRARCVRALARAARRGRCGPAGRDRSVGGHHRRHRRRTPGLRRAGQPSRCWRAADTAGAGESRRRRSDRGVARAPAHSGGAEPDAAERAGPGLVGRDLAG